MAYTTMFAVMTVILFAPFWTEGKTLVWQQDGVYQHYNAFVYLGTWARGIFKTLLTEHRLVIPMWEYSIGYGADVFTTLIYYVFGDPFALVSVFTPVKYADVGYTVAILLRFFMAGVVFSLYIRKLGAGKDASLLAALMYVFSAYALYSGIRHPFFLNPMVNLPLILLGAEKIFRKEKPWVYSLGVFVSAISNFYFFYMIVLLTVLYVAVRVLSDKTLRKQILVYLGIFAGYALLGVAMAGVILFPMVLYFVGNSRAGEVQQFSMFYTRAEYEKLLGSFVSCSSGMHWAYVGTAPFALVGTSVLFLQKKRYTWLKILMGCSLIFLLFPVFGHVFNGFGYVTNRWSFFWPLLVCTAFALMYPVFLQMGKKEKIKLVLGCGVYAVACMLVEKAHTKDTITGCLVLGISLAYALLMPYIRVGWKKFTAGYLQFTLALGVVCASVLVMGASVYSTKGGNYAAQFLKRGEAYKVLYKDRASYWNVIENDRFYRIDNAAEDNKQKNFALTTGQTTTTFYWSVVDAAMAQYLMENSVYTGTSYTFKTMLSRSLLLPLASAEYYVAGDTKAQLASVPYGYESLKKEGKDTGVYQSALALPLGYTYDTVISRADYEQMSVVQKQQAMLQGAVLADEDFVLAQDLSETSPEFCDQNVQYTVVDADGVTVEQNTLSTDKENAQITLQFDPLEDGELYVQLTNLAFESQSKYSVMTKAEIENLSAKKKKKAEHALKYWTPETETKIIASSGDMQTGDYHYEKTSSHTVGRRDYLLNLAYSSEKRNQITLTFTKRGVYTFDALDVLWQPVRQMDGQVAALRENILTDEQISANKITGQITLNQTKLMCLSVPYSKGWHLYVDGRKADLFNVNTMYMGTVLDKGTHTIELRYCTPHIKTGAILSVLGWCLFGFGCKKKKKVKKG